MKKLVENSIVIKKIGGPLKKNIFNLLDSSLPENPTQEEINIKKLNDSLDESIRRNNYIDISNFPGKDVTVFFKYEEGLEEFYDKISYTIPEAKKESEIKEYIISEINSYLEN